MGIAALLLFVMIPTSLPSSGVPAASPTTGGVWIVHGRAGIDVVSECLEEVKSVCHLLQTATPRIERFQGFAEQ